MDARTEPASEARRETAPSHSETASEPASTAPAKRGGRGVPLLITLVTATIAVLLGWAMWDVYMAAPWTRDATVRAYVVAMTPEVAGRIVELHVVIATT